MAVSTEKCPKVKRKDKLTKSSSGVTKKIRGGGTLIQSPAVFSDNTECIYINSGWCVKSFSIKTGECAKILETSMSGHGRVLSIIKVQKKPVIVTLDESNKVHLLHWDYESNCVEKKIEVVLPKDHREYVGVHAMLVPSVTNSLAEDLCLVVGKQCDIYRVLFFNPVTADFIQHPLNGTDVGFGVGKHYLSFGGPPDLRIMATVVRGVGLCVYSLDGRKKNLNWSAGKDLEWASVCCHPMEPSVAVGDSLGRCVLYRNPLHNFTVKTTFHWHTLPCDVISFTPAGSTMYTGGGEHVLVKWNIENPNVKNFLPRLSAPLAHISVSPDNSLVAVSTLDNGVILVESSHRVSRVLQQLAWGVISTKSSTLFQAGLTFDSVSHSVVLNSRPGHLQFFCPETESLNSIDICRQNYLTQERNKVIVNTDVTLVALSSDSAWMSTVETRNEPNTSLELRLKFWDYQISSKRWALNSIVDMPHSGPIISMKFQPVTSSSSTEYLLVTTGEDAKFRLWSPSPIDSIYKKGVVWKCEGASSYKDHKAGPASFSQDGSLLAVAFEHILTLWSSDGIKFKTSLSRYPPHIRQLEFGRDSCSHMLVATTDSEVTVWNLLTLSVQWSANVRPSLLISNPSSIFMAVVSNKSKRLYVFSPLYPDIIHVEKNLCGSKTKILGATFASRETDNNKGPSWLFKSTFYYIDSNQELKSIESASDEGLESVVLVEDREKPTLFSDLKEAWTVSAVEKRQDSHPRNHQYGIVGASAVSEFLRAPCHTMAPVSALCSSLLEAFSLSKKSVKEREEREMDESMDMCDEDMDEGIGNESDSDTEDRSRNALSKSSRMDQQSAIPKTPLVLSETQPDDLFFIDVDEEVNNIINS